MGRLQKFFIILNNDYLANQQPQKKTWQRSLKSEPLH
jgi:hypothetical protein